MMKRLLFAFGTAILFYSGIALPSLQAQAEPNSCIGPNVKGCSYGLPAEVYEKLLAEMKANPAPAVEPVEVDKSQVYRYAFWRVAAGTEIFDTPNGKIIGKMDDGFNFVSIYKQQDGFAMLRNQTWVRRASLKQTSASLFAGVLHEQALKYPMAWVIQASIPSSYPGGARDPKLLGAAIPRYARVNIYATVKVDNWNWYLVGPGQWLEQRKVARVETTTRPSGAQKWVAVDLYEQTLAAYEGDKLLFSTLISSGLPDSQTNIGTFKVYKKIATTAMTGAMGQPSFYSLPQVPYAMFFDNDISLHGTYWHDGFGFKRSRGCVNMSISDAHWVYEWVGDDDLTVVVWHSGSQPQ